jgi:hypothetical protein
LVVSALVIFSPRFKEFGHYAFSPLLPWLRFPFTAAMVISDPDSFLVTEEIVIVPAGLTGSIFHLAIHFPSPLVPIPC